MLLGPVDLLDWRAGFIKIQITEYYNADVCLNDSKTGKRARRIAKPLFSSRICFQTTKPNFASASEQRQKNRTMFMPI